MKTILIAATLLAQQPGFSSPPEKPCLTRAEAASMGRFFMPSVIDSMARKCAASLPATAFLAGPHRALSARLREDHIRHWPSAKTAIEKVSGKELPTMLGDEFTRKMAESTVAEMAAKGIEAKDCAMVSEILGVVAPLPADNFGRLFALFAELGSKKRDKSPFRMCPGATA
ncbi:hypothetical protein [Allosphingosinicella vermicomposti]|uniref:hypothetical protein n=1 Tax=Allosphingosinicella vermicomposti TaxID=614671 RepID=UPI000D1131A3|nr:hypothetical protein [Allosphingosinicella vermicomposti]